MILVAIGPAVAVRRDRLPRIRSLGNRTLTEKDGLRLPPLDAVAIPRRTPERAAKLLDLPKGLAEQINACTAVDHITSPLERDDGSIEVIHGWRAHHFLHRQPVEGASG